MEASMSGCIGPSMQTPCDGNIHAASTPWSSMQAQAGVAVEPLGMRAGVFAGQLVADPGLAALPREVVVERTRTWSGVHVARAGDDRMGPLPEEVAGLAVDFLAGRHPGRRTSGRGAG